MTEIQKSQLEMAQDFCDEEDRSTEFMLQYMQDVSGCSLDEVIGFLSSRAEKRDE